MGGLRREEDKMAEREAKGVSGAQSEGRRRGVETGGRSKREAVAGGGGGFALLASSGAAGNNSFLILVWCLDT